MKRNTAKSGRLVVTDEYLYNSGMVKEVTKVLDAMNVTHMEFFDVTPILRLPVRGRERS